MPLTLRPAGLSSATPAVIDYFGSAGLLWAINGGRLVELHRDWAVIYVPVHRSRRIFNRQNVDAAKMVRRTSR